MAELQRGGAKAKPLGRSSSLRAVSPGLGSETEPDGVADSGDAARFPAFGGRSYGGIALQTIDSSKVSISPSPNVPHFVGSNGTLYDVHYNLATVPENCEAESQFNPYDPLYQLFPKVEDFKYYGDFEQALTDWYHDCRILLETVKLPQVMGRTFARPRLKTEKDALDEIGMQLDIHDEDGEDGGPGGDMPAPTPTEKVESTEPDEDEPEPEAEELAEEMDHDTWECQLYPAEPVPEDYDTEQEYEAAMVRWVIICSQLSTLPPHPHQFEKLLSIKQRAPEREVDEDKELLEAESLKEKLQALKINLWRDWAANVWDFDGVERSCCPVEVAPELDRRKLEAEREDKLMNQLDVMRASEYCFRYYPASTGERIKATLNQLVEQIEQNKKRFGSNNSPLLPVVHGTYVGEAGLDQRKLSSGLHQTYDHSVPLRRTDLTGEMMAASRDCRVEEHGKNVEFKTPVFWLGTMDLEKIQKEGEPRSGMPRSMVFKALNNALVRTDRKMFLERLNSYFWPKTMPEYTEALKAYVIGICDQETITLQDIRNIIFNPMHLDTFQTLLAAAPESAEDVNQVSYASVILRFVNEDNFEEILGMFDCTRSELTQSKIAHFVVETLQQSARAQAILKKYISNQNTHCMYRAAFAMSFFSDIPVNVWPDSPNIQLLVASVFGETFDAIVRQLMLLYFLNLVSDVIRKNTFLYVPINSYVAQSVQTISANLAAIISNDRFFVSSVFLGISHRSSSLSAFFLFLLVQLLRSPDKNIQEHMRGDKVDLLKNVRDLSYSKYTHVQYACRRLFHVLQGPKWWDWTLQRYQELLLEDLTTLPRPLPASAPMPLLIELCLEFLVNVFRSVAQAPQDPKGRERLSFVFAQDLFHKSLQRLVAQKGKADQTTLALSTVTCELTSCLATLQLIDGPSSRDTHKTARLEDTARRKAGALVLELHYQDLRNLLTVLTDIPERCYDVKTQLMRTLRRVIKFPGVFELFRKESVFFQTVQGFCKDGRDATFNMESWRMFFQCIRYHAGVLEWLHRHGLLSPFLESVGTSAGNVVMMSGLHYIAKLFTMVQREQERVGEGLTPVREDIRTMEKDVKLLTDIFMKKHLFIKIHMIFKRFSPAEGTGAAGTPGTPGAAGSAVGAGGGAAGGGGVEQPYPGAAFQKLVLVYNSLVQSPFCAKLLKDIMKNPEYRAGLTRIHSMASGSEEIDSAALLGGGSGKSVASPSMQRTQSAVGRVHKGSVSWGKKYMQMQQLDRSQKKEILSPEKEISGLST